MKVWLLWEDRAEKGENKVLVGVYATEAAARKLNQPDIEDGSLKLESYEVIS